MTKLIQFTGSAVAAATAGPVPSVTPSPWDRTQGAASVSAVLYLFAGALVGFLIGRLWQATADRFRAGDHVLRRERKGQR